MKITRKGYIEVFKGEEYISRHVSEWEAIESISRQGEGTFNILFPRIEVVVDDLDDYWPYQVDGSGTQTDIFQIPAIRVTNGTTASNG